jgi:hypothetical protein
LYWIIAPLQSAWNYLSNERSFLLIRLRTRELRPFYFVGASCPRLISECVTPKDIVNTKNWYRKGTELWAEFGKEAPFGRKFSSKDSVKILAVGSTPSFGKRAVCAWKRKLSGIRDDVARTWGRDELMTGAKWTLVPGH